MNKNLVEMVKEFVDKKKELSRIQEDMDLIKRRMDSKLIDYFENKEEKTEVISLRDAFSADEAKNYSVMFSQRKNVKFDVEKLEKNLTKEQAKKVISKSYEIVDMDRLAIYLKSQGVDSKVFASFLNIKKTIDSKTLDKLWETNVIKDEQVEGTYEIIEGTKIITIREKK